MTDRNEWVQDALCATVGGDLFFPEAAQSATPAKRICAACPVQANCLAEAIENNEEWGVWGGTSGRDRQGMRRRTA